MQNKYKLFSLILILFIILSVIVLSYAGLPRVFINTCYWIDLNIIKKLKISTDVSSVKYQLLDGNDKPVTNVLYDSIVSLPDDLYKVRLNKKTGVIDYNGKVVIPLKYNDISYNSGYFVVAQCSQIFFDYPQFGRNTLIKYGLFDIKGKKIFPVRYNNIRVSGKYFILGKEDRYFVYNKDKKKLCVFNSEQPPFLIEDSYFSVVENGKNIILDEKGRSVINIEYEELGKNRLSFSSGYMLNNERVFIIKINGKYGLVNLKSELVLPAIYDDIKSLPGMNNRIIWIKKDGKWGAIGAVTVNFVFDEVPDLIGDNRYIVKLYENKSKNEKVIYTKEQILDQEIKYSEKLKREQAEKNKRDKIKVEGELHSVSVYQGHYNETPGFSEHKTGTVWVDVGIEDRPVTLVLTSYESVIWKIKASSKTNIKKIYFSGYEDSDVDTSGKKIDIEKLNKRIYFSESTYSKINKIFDKAPVTMQYKYENDYFIVNGKEGKNYKVFPSPKSTDKEVYFICKYTYDCKLSPDGLTVGYGNVGASSVSLTNKYYNKGKYYFEAEFLANNANKSTFSNIGIISPNKDYNYCSFISSMDEDEECMQYGVFSFSNKKLKNKDIIGYAVDFDEGKIYISQNGEWVTGLPDKNKTTYTFQNDGRYYSAAVEVSEGSQWKVNFGASKFRYSVPSGFKPYDEYSAKKRK